MNVEFMPCVPQGQVTVPPSKSCAHRLLLSAALAKGESVISNVAFSEDILATLDCLRALGADCSVAESTVRIRGGVFAANGMPLLPCRESGSTLRFLIPTALLSGGGTFCGTKRLLDRGIGVYETLLRAFASFRRVSDTRLCIQGRLRPGSFPVPGDISSQFISGLLFALPLLDGDNRLDVIPPFESRGYVDLTLDAMRRFGVHIQRQNDCFLIPGGQTYQPATETVEGDWSQAAFFCAMNVLGGKVQLCGLNAQSLQGDRVCQTLLPQISGGPTEADLSDCPDLAPVLFAAAAACGHGARFTGTRRLSIKESNRAAVMAQELAKFGAKLQVAENAVTVSPGSIHTPEEPLQGCNDHRVVMALSVLAMKTGGTIQGCEAVRKSYPDYFEALGRLGVSMRISDKGA